MNSIKTETDNKEVQKLFSQLFSISHDVQKTDDESEFNFNDIKNILWANCFAEVIGRDRKDDDLINRARVAHRSLYKLRKKLRLPNETLQFKQ